MKTMEEIRREAMTLSAGERASLAHDLILSLEDPDAYELSPEQEAEIRKRVRRVKSGTRTHPCHAITTNACRK